MARSWSCSQTRIARCGTPGRSRPGAAGWTAHWRYAAAARTSCRRRSPPCRPRTAPRLPRWPQIAVLYARLVRCTGSAIVELNRAVAVAEAQGAAAGLAIVEALSPSLDEYQYLHSSRAELLRRLGRAAEARVAYGD